MIIKLPENVAKVLGSEFQASLKAGFFKHKEKELSREEAEEVFKGMGKGINQLYKKHTDLISWTTFADICINIIRLLAMK